MHTTNVQLAGTGEALQDADDVTHKRITTLEQEVAVLKKRNKACEEERNRDGQE
jgi:hypothetical protein